jgi:high affinity Mn2+ porin
MPMVTPPFRRCAALGLLITGLARAAAPDTAAPEDAAVHGQFTWTEQEVGAFTAPYAGPNSLRPNQGRETVDATLYGGKRLWSGLEGWVNLEVDQGFGLDNTLGIAGFPSGEAYKVGKNHPYLRLQRTFLRQTINVGSVDETVESSANQLAGARSTDRWVITAGKFGVTDIFDASRYAHDPRGDFLNWTAVDAGTFDYSADAWGFSAGIAVERYRGAWTGRVALFDLSTIPNNEHLTPGFHQFQWIGELEHRHTLGDRDGKVLVTVYDSRGRMGLLADAVALAAQTGGVPNVALVRSYRDRMGVSALAEQAVAEDVGVFARLGNAAGNVEAYEFTDVDASVEAGLSLAGRAWHRASDTVGVVAIRNRISAERTAYLAAGGLGILVGDGALTHPGAESIAEAYYAVALGSHLTLTADLQHVTNPAYNRDRGPVTIGALRVHAQF